MPVYKTGMKLHEELLEELINGVPPGPLAGGEGAGCPSSRTPTPALGYAGLRLRRFLHLGRKKILGHGPV